MGTIRFPGGKHPEGTPIPDAQFLRGSRAAGKDPNARTGKPAFSPSSQATQQFFAWAQRAVPEAFRRPKHGGMGEVPAQGAPPSQQGGNAVVDGLTTAVNLYVTSQERRDLFKFNLERMKQGLPPLDSTGEVARGADSSLPVTMKGLVQFGAIFLVGYVLLTALAPRRK